MLIDGQLTTMLLGADFHFPLVYRL